MKLLIQFVFVFFVLMLGAQPLEFLGKITAVKDGDTFKVLYQKREITVRLAHIDCPEKRQAFGTKAKQYASDLCFGRLVGIKHNGKKDRNGRIIGEVFVGNLNVNQELVKQGLAWHFKKYSKSKEYAQLENSARKRKVGIWSEKKPIAPWEWRKMRKNKKHS
ncbi:MAG: thermonuclease family protein [Flavobacteriaceae bacterium]|nr:thermonuclease family protein [Flavobacteriaceae bacterium]